MDLDWTDLLHASPDALIVTDVDGTVCYWSRGACEAFGFSESEALHRPLLELIVPAERANEELRIRVELDRSGSALCESMRRRKDGSLLYVDITAKCLTRDDGRPLYLYCEKNVTELKARRDAKWVHASFGQLLDSTPDGIVLVNATGHIVLANVHAAEMFNYAEGELVGRPIEQLLPNRFRHSHVGHRAAYIGQPRVRSMGAGLDLYGLRKGGDEFPVEISLSPLQTDEGAFIFSAIRDITQRKRFEIALRDTNAELERASAAKDHFLAGMSHELRTPLNAIIGFTGTLLMRLPGPLNDDQERHLNTVKVSAQHLLALINDLLDLAKIDAGKRELLLEDVDADVIVEEVASSLRLQAERKQLALQVEIAPGNYRFRSDARMLRQILLNLASNAIKFTDHGGVRLCCEQRQHAEGRELVFHIRDSGIGIRAEDQDQLFDAFTRLSDAPLTRREGTGLGLHLTRKLVELLDGQITMHSVPGKGSTFTVTLREST